MSPPPPPARTRLRAALRRGRAALPPQERQEQSDALRRVVIDHLRRTPAWPGGGDGAGHATDDDGAGSSPVVAAFLGLPPEPATEPLLGELHELGFRIVLPVCEPEHRLSWVFWTPGVPLERSAYAPVDEPSGARHAFSELAHVVVVLVPALGTDPAGNRLGQGGGYYDRFLAQHPRDAPDAVPRYAVVYRSELLPAGEVPTDSWDQPMNGVFTPDGLLEVRPSAQPG